SKFSLFADFDAVELAEILFLARPISFTPGTCIFRQGDPSDGMYLVRKGSVRICARLLGDAEVELGRVGAGELIGEVSLVDRGVRTATASVLEQTEGYFFSTSNFEVLRNDLKSSAYKAMNSITRTLCERIRRQVSQIGNTGPGSWPSMTLAQAHFRNSGGADESDYRSTKTVDRHVLGAIPLFQGFREDELELFLAPLKRLDATRGTELFAQGDDAERCYLVVRGALRLGIASGGVDEQLMILAPGQIAGEVALMDDQEHPWSCAVREGAILLEMSRDQFKGLRHEGNPVAFKFFDRVNQSLVIKLRKTIRHITRIAAQGRLSTEEALGAEPTPAASG
ncbi:MAG: cyclic nucleotide-binding domain-containing protein, partial [bacterium]